jgi:molybdopterin synthase catalytic subunit
MVRQEPPGAGSADPDLKTVLCHPLHSRFCHPASGCVYTDGTLKKTNGGTAMKKITRQAFEELLEKDGALKAKAKAYIGEDGATAEKAVAFAASQGYELDLTGSLQELSLDELGQVAGGDGGIFDKDFKTLKNEVICKQKGHIWKLSRTEKGTFWGYNNYYKCERCGRERTEWV